MSTKHMSKNEPSDKTVDKKLEKWREKSIALEQQRQQEEEERKKQGKWKCFLEDTKHLLQKQPKAAAAAGAVLAAVVLILIAVITVAAGKVNPEKYITIQYTGANGYASAECVIDSDKLYQKLSGRKKDTEKLEQYRAFADSLRAEVKENDIANKQKITVSISYDEQLAKEAGIKLSKQQYHVRAKGIGEGTKIDLFSQVEVIFAGVSPDAYAVVSNKWEEEYLKDLTFSVDKTEEIRKGDTVTVTCDTDTAELARHGYVAAVTAVTVTADNLSVYAAKAEELDQEVLSNITGEVFDTIEKQTENSMFRMLYKATGNEAYLRSSNNETASDIELLDIYFLKRKDGISGEKDNYLYYLCRATIENEDTQEEVYFAFVYTNGYITSDGRYEIMHDYSEQRYICSSDYDAVYDEAITQKEEAYQIVTVQ